jgi:predicted  nucleic acid-binding Zn-ribbon protein
MATDKTKQEKEMTVEERLKALYSLQTLLSKVDKIKTLRGELPLEVQDLEDEVARLETRIQNFKNDIDSYGEGINMQKRVMAEAEALIQKYTEQQNNVQNNKEYDFLSKEIEFQHLNIELANKRVNELNRQIEAKNNEVASADEHLADVNHILAEKKGELEQIVSETKQEEEALRDKAKKLENKIEDRLLTAFKRIRKNARNGLAVVYVQRNACGGCFNRIPAQREAEIKMRKKIIVCEYCGRIMIDPALAGVNE